ncbi:MAG: flagellar basal body rod protein FlgB [Cellulosilyticaceae bacterium]
MDLFRHLDVTQKALDATMLKQQVITQNLANVDTPRYRRSDVKFEEYLDKQIRQSGISQVNAAGLEPTVYQQYADYTGRLDGNNVNIDTETAELSKTKIKYDALIQRTNAQIQRYKYILQNIR